MTLVVFGDSLLDRDVQGDVERLCPDAPALVLAESQERRRPGGAALAATLARRHDVEVTLITALGGAAGAEVRELAEAAGVRVVDVGMSGATPEKVRLQAAGRTLMRLDRSSGPALDLGPLGLEARAALSDAAAVLVSDYGGGLSAHLPVRCALERAAGDRPVVWDPHPRGAAPVCGVALATPNRGEARVLVPEVAGSDLRCDADRARTLRRRWTCDALAVTLGDAGALLETGSAAPTVVPAPAGGDGDTCGAGDRFAASAAVRLMTGASADRAVAGAVADATAFVLDGAASAGPPSRPAGGDPGTMEHAVSVAERVRARSGTVVATGGCFDLLHAGHLATLEAARRLGDCLIVLINSDRSVGELKGPGRPVVGERDRARLLCGLGCVDAVAVFDDPTPVAALEVLRPAVFAKGGDYGGVELPEAAVMRRTGGQTVILPTVDGHSTTSLIDRAVSLSVVA